MKGLLVAALLVTSSMLLAGCATGEKPMQESGLAPLSHSDLEALMSRTRTARWTSAKGVSGTATYAQDGTAQLQWNGGGAQGSWRIDADKFCTKYPTIRGGNETCFTFYKIKDNEYKSFLPDGTYNATAVYTN